MAIGFTHESGNWIQSKDDVKLCEEMAQGRSTRPGEKNLTERRQNLTRVAAAQTLGAGITIYF
jgi:hypothetical protein